MSSIFKGKNILVTGGGGFIGSHLTESLLALGAKVRVPVQPNDKKTKIFLKGVIDKVELLECDLTSMTECIKATKGIDFVFHLAGFVRGVGYNKLHAADMLTINTLINTNVLEAARINGIERYLFTSSACGYPLNAKIPLVEDDFFSAVEVRRPNDQNVLDGMKKLLESANIDVIIAGQPPLLVGKLNLNNEIKEEREKAIADVKQSIDAANFLNAKAVIILSGSAVDADKKDNAKKMLIESLNEICQYAQVKNPKLFISLETFDDKIDKKCLAGATSFSVEIALVVKKKYKNFGLTIDLSHLPLLNEKSDYTLETAKKHLYHIHVGNCILKDRTHPAYGDWHPRFGIAGGENSVKELAEFIKLLFEIDFLS